MGVQSIVASARRLLNQTLLDRIIRLKQQQVRDSLGGASTQWVPIGGKIPARFGQLSEADSAGRQMRPVQGQMEGVAGGTLLVALGVALDEGDRVRDVATGRVWVVMGEATPPSEVAVVRRLYIREI